MIRGRAFLAVVSAATIAAGWFGPWAHRRPAVSLSRQVGDCEAIATGWLAQPANSLTSLALVAVGVLMFDGSRRPRSVLGLATAVAGTGSALLHGTTSAVGSTLDALGVGLLIAAIAGLTVQRQISTAFSAAFGAVLAPAAALTFLDGPDMLWLAIALLTAGAVEWIRRPSRYLAIAGIAAAAGFAAWFVGQTASGWCRPESLLQFHAVWHVAAAGSLLALGSHYGKG